jgi:DNA repair exonuclease SbcCD ATPase subunit
LKADAQKLSVRQKLAQKLTEERQQYESLLERIKAEEDELATVSDVNQDMVKLLSELKKKTEDAIASVNDEISKLSKA